MTQDEVIEMARDAGAYEDFAFKDEYFDMSRQALERFANLVAAKEREACAKVADGYVGADPIADAIRARGQA